MNHFPPSQNMYTAEGSRRALWLSYAKGVLLSYIATGDLVSIVL